MDQINRTGSSTTKQQSPQHPEHLDDEKIQRNSKETEGTTNEYVLVSTSAIVVIFGVLLFCDCLFVIAIFFLFESYENT
jgi:hypothetical protein